MDTKPGVYACLRCKSRKIKCDRSTPKCTPCERAESSCLTIDPASGRKIPRGYVDHLESRVKELEAELAQARLRPAASAAASSAWSPELDLPSYQSDADGPVATGSWREPFNYKALNARPLSLPTDLPSKADAERLLKGYFERSNAIIPVLHREQFIIRAFEPIYGPISPDLQLCSDFTVLRVERSASEPRTGTFYRRWVDCGGSLTAVPEPRIQISLFFLYMIFALAIVTDEQQRGGPAEGSRMYAAAMCYYTAVARESGSLPELLRSIQALLLRAVYGLIVPSQPAAWYATGTVMRMCIKLGFHNESKVKFEGEENAFNTDMRRRLFWSSYYMDRVVSVYLGRPANIGEEYIHCELPSMADDSWLMPPEIPVDDSNSKVTRRNPRLHHHSEPAADTIAIPDRVAKLSEGASPKPSSGSADALVPPDRPSYKWVFNYMLRLRRIQHAAKVELYDRADFDDQTNVREIRDKIADDLEKWYHSIPSSSDMFNFNFSLKYLEVNYYYTLMLLYRSSRGIPNPTVEETRRMLSAGTRVLTMYVQHRNNIGFVYSWAAVHNVLHAASSCLFGLYRTNILDDEYDLNAFEHLMEKIMSVVDKLKSSYGASPSAYGPLHTMMRVTLDVLRSRGPEPWRKRARKLPNGQPNAQPTPGSDSLVSTCLTGAVTAQLENNTDGVQAFPPETSLQRQAREAVEAGYAKGAAGSGATGPASQASASPQPASNSPPSATSSTTSSVTPSMQGPGQVHQLLSNIGSLDSGEPFRTRESHSADTRGGLNDSNGETRSRYDATKSSVIASGSTTGHGPNGGSHSGPNGRPNGDATISSDNNTVGMTSGLNSVMNPGMVPTMTNAPVAAGLDPNNVLGPTGAGFGWFEPREHTDPMQPLIVPRAVSESLAPMIPGFNEDTQYNEFQVYDILDEISQYFDGYSVTQSLTEPDVQPPPPP